MASKKQAEPPSEVSMKEFKKFELYVPELIGTKNKVNWEAFLSHLREHPMATDACVTVINDKFLVDKKDQVTRSSCVRKLNAEVKKGNLGKFVASHINPETNKKHTVAWYGPPTEGQQDMRPMLRRERAAQRLKALGAEQHESDTKARRIPTIELPGSATDEGGDE